MPRWASRDIYVRTLENKDSSRFVDLAVEFVDERDLSLIFAAGGRWDKLRKEWSDQPARSAMQVRCHEGQLETVEWFRDWFEAYQQDEDLDPAIYSAMLLGGTRAGKTWIAKNLMVAFSIAVPAARVWAVQEVDVERADELETELDELLPAAWFTKTGRRYKCVNGTSISIRSAKYPHKLKRGRCDFAFLNEAQNVPEASHNMLRMRTSDTGGLVLSAANPPNDNELGEWVATYSEECRAGRRKNARCFHYDYTKNPHVSKAQLEALRAETDPRTFDIEVLGKVLPPSNAVMHAFSIVHNVDPIPELPGLDITGEFLKRKGLGSNAVDFACLDFQRSPHMAGVVGRAFKNPDDPDRPLIYWRNEVIVDLGDEHDLSDGLYDAGLDPATTVLIVDASGFWQDADRTKGSSSVDILRKCGWRRVFPPDRKTRKNPPVHERHKNDNRLFAAEDGSHIVRIDPACVNLIEACKKWRRKGAVADKNSIHAHIGDCIGYGHWRLYPRRWQSRRVEYKRLQGRKRADQLRNL